MSVGDYLVTDPGRVMPDGLNLTPGQNGLMLDGLNLIPDQKRLMPDEAVVIRHQRKTDPIGAIMSISAWNVSSSISASS